MEKIIIVIIMFIASTVLQAQDKRYTVFGSIDPGATYKDGFNIGVGVEYQMTYTYVKTQLFAFPDLRGKDYFEWTSVPFTSINLHSLFDEWRYYSGFKIGLIKREAVHPTIGFEAGIDRYFDNGFYIGVTSSEDLRTDGKEWEPDIENYWRLSTFFKIGVAF
ncbi:hypothetical protein [Flavivirga spongiicola]|uniref:Outer membrane protein beta-barrel domain-containing protein n=1 Tax=Flavivirga spongiicola TaxID=421621 RepID=A0ABU7XYC0_9FLAO|nr:hypothetical protein [Flavivirga sp. MEBiC05379]MDO5980784.1 hypothetical protein [Flavivirga sp. MEBiC05379]